MQAGLFPLIVTVPEKKPHRADDSFILIRYSNEFCILIKVLLSMGGSIGGMFLLVKEYFGNYFQQLLAHLPQL